jgi:hypothetical protein
MMPARSRLGLWLPLGALLALYALVGSTRAHWPASVTLQWGADGTRALTPLAMLVEATIVAASLYLLFFALERWRPDARRTRLLAPIRALLPTGLVVVYAGLFAGAAFGGVFRGVGIGLGLACCLAAVFVGVARAGIAP